MNFGNGIVDDERFGMRRFLYHNNDNSPTGDPKYAPDYYLMLQGIWKDGNKMMYGGNAYPGVAGTVGPACDFMFPGDTDPCNWGTGGVNPNGGYNSNGKYWTDSEAGNEAADRRFMQSAGPFTLKPGALNYVTVGIPFAQAPSGRAESSVDLLREIDDVCQALFENCFKVLDGPDAPSLIVQEMNNEIILYVKYDNPTSNNYGEHYSEIDPAIVRSYTTGDSTYFYSDDQRSYKFEGYQIYQLKDANVSIADIRDITKAQLVAQCDIKNFYDSTESNPQLPIGTLVNYTQNSTTGLLQRCRWL